MPIDKKVFIGSLSVYILFKIRDIYDEYKIYNEQIKFKNDKLNIKQIKQIKQIN